MREICQPPSSKAYLPMNLFRKASIYLTIFFVYLRIKPTTITFLRFFVGLIGILLICFGQYNLIVAGLLVFHLAIFLDLNDGEMFRYYTWKSGKKESVLVGSFLDKNFDHAYRPLLLIAAGIVGWINPPQLPYLSGEFFLFLGIIGSVLISLDQIFKLRTFEILVYKNQLKYLKSEKAAINAQTGRFDWFYELFRINNPLTLYFWFGIFGFLPHFLILYLPLLAVQTIKTFIVQYSSIKDIDKQIISKMYKNN